VLRVYYVFGAYQLLDLDHVFGVNQVLGVHRVQVLGVNEVLGMKNVVYLFFRVQPGSLQLF